MLDTRQYRDGLAAINCTPAQRDPASAYCPGEIDPARTILGTAQRDWLFEGLAGGPRGGWNVIANQVGFAPQATVDTTGKHFVLNDSWDGYVADRQRLLDFVAGQDLRNVVVITGDKHENSVRNVARSYTDIGGSATATEFVCTSISTDGTAARRRRSASRTTRTCCTRIAAAAGSTSTPTTRPGGRRSGSSTTSRAAASPATR